MSAPVLTLHMEVRGKVTAYGQTVGGRVVRNFPIKTDGNRVTFRFAASQRLTHWEMVDEDGAEVCSGSLFGDRVKSGDVMEVTIVLRHKVALVTCSDPSKN